MMTFSILDSLNLQSPAVSLLNPTDWHLANSYLQDNEYKIDFKYLSHIEWYETVHTFLLLICEAEGI